MRRASPPQCRGVALISVLWVVAIMSSVAGAAVLQSRTDARLSRNEVNISESRQMADGGIRLGVHMIRTRGSSGSAPQARLDQSFEVEGYKISVAVRNETSRIDVNKAPRELLFGLLIQFMEGEDQAAALADAILDWRDGDDERRTDGAEERDYMVSGLSYLPTNDEFLSVYELRLVLGMTDQIFNGIKDYVTIYSGQSGIFPSGADQVVLLAAGGSAPTNSRNGNGQFRAISGLQRNLIARRPGNVFRIVSVAESRNGYSISSSAIVRLEPGRTPEPFRVLASNVQSQSESGGAF